MASQGAEGESFNVLRRGLHLEGSHEQIANEYNRQLAGVKKSIGAATLKVANKVFVQQNYSIKKAFYDVAVNKYDSEVESVNFGNGPIAAKTINAWVEDKTNNKIKDLVNADSFSSDSRLVLVNAIYFKGPWEKKFDPELTADDDFWTSKTQSKKIPYMNKKDDFLYGVFPEYNISALALKYNNSDFSFLILLPNERDGLPQLEAQLDKINLSELSEKMYKQEVNVKIPKMKIESSFKLKEVLSEVCMHDELRDCSSLWQLNNIFVVGLQLGMDNIFNDGANFSGLLDSDEKLKVSDVVHKAFIEVNEEGAEAAAATGKFYSHAISCFLFCCYQTQFVFLFVWTKMLFLLTFSVYFWIFPTNALSPQSLTLLCMFFAHLIYYVRKLTFLPQINVQKP